MNKVIKCLIKCSLVIIFGLSSVPDLYAGVQLYEKEDFSLEISGRIQPRFQWINDDKNNRNDVYDFFVRRTRLSFIAKYMEVISGKLEWKIDNIERFEADDPSAKAENAFVRFDFFNQQLIFDLGLTDGVFSREGRLSDSVILFTEESLIQNALKSFELADNATGLHITGKLMERHLDYGVGIYDGLDDNGNSDDDLAYQLALVYHIFDVEESRQGSHIGDGKTYLTVGTYYGIQTDVLDNSDEFDANAYGFDVFSQFGTQFVPGTVTVSAGYFVIDEDFDNKSNADNDGYYIEGAYLLPEKVGRGKMQGNLEFAMRYGEYDPDRSSTTFTQEQEQLSLGINYYIIKHNVKVQATYNINDSDSSASNDNDDFTVQVQLAI